MFVSNGPVQVPKQRQGKIKRWVWVHRVRSSEKPVNGRIHIPNFIPEQDLGAKSVRDLIVQPSVGLRFWTVGLTFAAQESVLKTWKKQQE